MIWVAENQDCKNTSGAVKLRIQGPSVHQGPSFDRDRKVEFPTEEQLRETMNLKVQPEKPIDWGSDGAP